MCKIKLCQVVIQFIKDQIKNYVENILLNVIGIKMDYLFQNFAPVELHLVHFNLAYGDSIEEAVAKSNNAWDTLAVLAVLIDIQDEDNHNFDQIRSGWPFDKLAVQCSHVIQPNHILRRRIMIFQIKKIFSDHFKVCFCRLHYALQNIELQINTELNIKNQKKD